jgi:hypothetical protein
MKEYISSYISEITEYMNGKMAEDDRSGIGKVLDEFEVKIAFFQHERLIHLIVTVLFAIMEMMSIYTLILSANVSVVVFCVMFLVLLVPYVMHYYFLENSVQKMYHMRDEIRAFINKDKVI